MSLESALMLAEKGFHVFPLIPNSKLPAIKDYPNRATRDPNQIREWFKRPHNIGISTTRFKDGEALVVVDVDNKGDKKGSDELLKLELEGRTLPYTFNQKTPTGGCHMVYRTSKPLKQGVNVLGPGLDIRAQGGYIVGNGSTLDGKEYWAHLDAEINPAPEWLVEKLGEAKQKEEQKKIGGLNAAQSEARAIEYLKTADVSIEGQGGNETAYQVACRVKDFGVDHGVCALFLEKFWNPNCQPPWSPEELEKIVDNAYQYGANPIGALSPEADFKPIVEEKKKSYLQEINDNHALVFVEGGHFVIHETIDEKGRVKRVFYNEQTFKRKFSPYLVQYDNGKSQTFANVWLSWPKRREYKGVCFAPEREARHNYYNLWRGFTCEALDPKKANAEQQRGLQMFLDHAKENVCGGEEDLFNWLMGYFAQLVQKPYERPLTTLVFKGAKGTGKNTLVDRIGNLLGGSHYLTAHDSRYLTSNFNGHLDSCLMLVLDEAFWSGDKNAEGKLKGLTTSPEIMIERKGKEPYVVDNLVRLVVIGNEDWLVPATADERRYAVFQMGEARKLDNEYFAEMRILLDERGGNRCLLHYLKTFDLKKVDVNRAPATDALLEQKTYNLPIFEQWWMKCLEEGKIIHSDFTDTWPEVMSKDLFRNAYDRYAKLRNVGGWTLSDIAIGKKIRRCCKSARTNMQHREAEKFVKDYRFPTLQRARVEWEMFIGHKVKWEQE